MSVDEYAANLTQVKEYRNQIEKYSSENKNTQLYIKVMNHLIHEFEHGNEKTKVTNSTEAIRCDELNQAYSIIEENMSLQRELAMNIGAVNHAESIEQIQNDLNARLRDKKEQYDKLILQMKFAQSKLENLKIVKDKNSSEKKLELLEKEYSDLQKNNETCVKNDRAKFNHYEKLLYSLLIDIIQRNKTIDNLSLKIKETMIAIIDLEKDSKENKIETLRIQVNEMLEIANELNNKKQMEKNLIPLMLKHVNVFKEPIDIKKMLQCKIPEPKKLVTSYNNNLNSGLSKIEKSDTQILTKSSNRCQNENLKPVDQTVKAKDSELLKDSNLAKNLLKRKSESHVVENQTIKKPNTSYQFKSIIKDCPKKVVVLKYLDSKNDPFRQQNLQNFMKKNSINNEEIIVNQKLNAKYNETQKIKQKEQLNNSNNENGLLPQYDFNKSTIFDLNCGNKDFLSTNLNVCNKETKKQLGSNEIKIIENILIKPVRKSNFDTVSLIPLSKTCIKQLKHVQNIKADITSNTTFSTSQSELLTQNNKVNLNTSETKKEVDISKVPSTADVIEINSYTSGMILSNNSNVNDSYYYEYNNILSHPIDTKTEKFSNKDVTSHHDLKRDIFDKEQVIEIDQVDYKCDENTTIKLDKSNNDRKISEETTFLANKKRKCQDREEKVFEDSQKNSEHLSKKIKPNDNFIYDEFSRSLCSPSTNSPVQKINKAVKSPVSSFFSIENFMTKTRKPKGQNKDDLNKKNEFTKQLSFESNQSNKPFDSSDDFMLNFEGGSNIGSDFSFENSFKDPGSILD